MAAGFPETTPDETINTHSARIGVFLLASENTNVLQPLRKRGIMDPVTLILTALAAGAAAAAKDTASQAIKDAYSGLKAIVQRRFTGQPQAGIALQHHEADQDTWKKPLEKSLTDNGAAQDPEIVAKAQRILQLVHPEQYAQGKFNVQTTGTVQGQQIGDYGTQHNVFGGKN